MALTTPFTLPKKTWDRPGTTVGQLGEKKLWDSGTATGKPRVYSDLARPVAFGTLGTLAGQTKIKRLVVNTHLKDR